MPRLIGKSRLCHIIRPTSPIDDEISDNVFTVADAG